MTSIGWLPIVVGILGFCLTVVLPGLITVAALGFAGYMLWKYYLGPQNRRQELERSKSVADGVIVEIAKGDVAVTDTASFPKYQFWITVDVKPPNGRPFRSKGCLMLSEYQLIGMGRGDIVTVHYDPNNLKEVAIDLKQQAPTQMATLTAGDDERKSQPQRVLAKAVILRSKEVGRAANGDLVVELDVLVHPDDRPAFESRVAEIVSQESASIFSPGVEIKVSYDPDRPEQVTVSRS